MTRTELPQRDRPALSVVIPFFDEEACVDEVVAEVVRVLDDHGVSFELVAVDDGSGDRTRERLELLAASEPRLRVLALYPNRGQAAALMTGMRSARAPILVTMDGDGQNDPRDIPALLEALDQADMVVGIRADRHDSWPRRAMSRLANAVRGRLLGDRMRDSGCALKVLRRPVVDSFLPIRTLYSFMPAFALAAGYRLAQLPVRHRPRRGGKSSYGLRAFWWRPLVDLIGVWWFTRRRFRDS